MKGQLIPTEAQEQSTVIQWCKMHEQKYPWLKYIYASMSGMRTNWKTAKKSKSQGMRSGFPDLFLPVFNSKFNGLFIEMKRVKNSSTSKEQKDFIAHLAREKYFACVCKGASEAIAVIKVYLDDRLC